ncbi:MAG: hypothetical protein EZS28_044120, partial [Streblomastix strix]
MLIIRVMKEEEEDLDEVTGNELEDYQAGEDDYYSEEGDDDELSYGYSDGEGGDQMFYYYYNFCSIIDKNDLRYLGFE